MRFTVIIILTFALYISFTGISLADPGQRAAQSWIYWPIADAPKYTAGNAFFAGSTGGVDSVTAQNDPVNGVGFIVRFGINQLYLNEQGEDSTLTGLNETAYVSLPDVMNVMGSCSALSQFFHNKYPSFDSQYKQTCWYDESDPVYQPVLITPASDIWHCDYMITTVYPYNEAGMCNAYCNHYNAGELLPSVAQEGYYIKESTTSNTGTSYWYQSCTPDDVGKVLTQIECAYPRANYCPSEDAGIGSASGLVRDNGVLSLDIWNYHFYEVVTPAVYGPPIQPIPSNPHPPTDANVLAEMQALLLSHPELLDPYRPAFAHSNPVFVPSGHSFYSIPSRIRNQLNTLESGDLENMVFALQDYFGYMGDGVDPSTASGAGLWFTAAMDQVPASSVVNLDLWGRQVAWDFADYAPYFPRIKGVVMLICTGYALRVILRSRPEWKN
jgi:hypothetical protein